MCFLREFQVEYFLRQKGHWRAWAWACGRGREWRRRWAGNSVRGTTARHSGQATASEPASPANRKQPRQPTCAYPPARPRSRPRRPSSPAPSPSSPPPPSPSSSAIGAYAPEPARAHRHHGRPPPASPPRPRHATPLSQGPLVGRRREGGNLGGLLLAMLDAHVHTVRVLRRVHLVAQGTGEGAAHFRVHVPHVHLQGILGGKRFAAHVTLAPPVPATCNKVGRERRAAPGLAVPRTARDHKYHYDHHQARSSSHTVRPPHTYI